MDTIFFKEIGIYTGVDIPNYYQLSRRRENVRIM